MQCARVATQQMLELSAIGAELSGREEQLQKELDALKAEARAQEATRTGLERRNVRDQVAKRSVAGCVVVGTAKVTSSQ